ncbi:MAG: MMPL family transporter [Proteobacteria bacterium]|nr:MMPL family transporter [Pseudomonadota bacterium]
MKEKQDAPRFGRFSLGRVSLILAAPAMRWAIPMLLLIVLVTGALVPSALTIQNDDDVIKFLPQDDPKIVKFKDVGDKFHGLQMAIVGIEAKDTIFTLDNITLLRRYATEFKKLECHKVDNNGDWIIGEDGQPVMTPCVSNTTCFTEIQDIGHEKDEAGEVAVITDLVPGYPEPGSPEALEKADEIAASLAKVQKHVRTLDHVNGFLVSDDGKAAAVYAQVDDVNVGVKEAADLIKARLLEIKKEMNADVEVYYGGSPFIGAYSADQARLDMTRLTPWVIAIVTLIIWITSRSILATLIALFSVGVSIVWVIGAMSLFGLKLTLISTSLPILLMALGSAYSIHLINAMLSRLDEGMSRKDAIREALIHTGPPVIVCVATTAAGFFSFLAMDVKPMVEYGAAMGLSTIVIMLVTFWVVTSASILLPIKPQKGGRAPKWAIDLIKKGSDAIYRKGAVAAVVVGIMLVAACFLASRVEPHGDNSSLFAEGSLPVRTDDFMNDNFGGANFIQTEINADISSPLVLRQVERITALIKSHERIAGIQSISDIVNLVGGSMGDGQHITESPIQAKNLTALAFANDASVAMELSMCSCETPAKNGICLPECVSPKDGSCLTTCDPDMQWRHSLMQIRVAGKDLSEGASLADELQEQMIPLFAPRIAVPRANLNDRARDVEKQEIRQHLKWIFKAYEHRNDPATGLPFVTAPLTDEQIDQAIFATSLDPSRADIRETLNNNLFADPDLALILLALEPERGTIRYAIKDASANGILSGLSEAQQDEIADKSFEAIQNNAFSEDKLNAMIAEQLASANAAPDAIREAAAALYPRIRDAKADLDSLTDQIYAALQNGTYTEDMLFNTIRHVLSDAESNEQGVREGVSFLHQQIVNTKIEKTRELRAQKLFEITGVKAPSDKFDELVKSAIWSLDDKNVFLPKNDFPELHSVSVDFHSADIAKDITSALADNASREQIDQVLGEKLFDVARIYYFDVTPEARASFRSKLADDIAASRAAGTYSTEWLTGELHKSMKIGEEIEVIPSGYPIIYRAMNASVIHNQIVSLVYSFIMVLICLILFTMSMHMGAISVIPAVLTVLFTFGIMGLFGLGLDVGSSMIAAISLSVGIDYACHLIWKFGRPEKTAEACKAASDHMIETTGWGVVINALEIGLGLSVLYFGDLLPMRNFGVLTGIAMIISATASLLLLSGLMRWARMHSSRKDVKLGEGMKQDNPADKPEAAPAS